MSFPGIIELTLSGRGPSRGFLFDPHRLALPCWAEASKGTASVLVTFDRHFDLCVPANPPGPGLTPADYDAHARTRLDEKNVDHIIAAMEAGLVSDVVAIARTWPIGATKVDRYVTTRGSEHRIVTAPTLERLLERHEWRALLATGSSTLLDFDLDCFTTPSDADPFTLIPWPRAVIADFLSPRDADDFWATVLGSCRALTFAREPNHCGGVIASNRLFEEASRVIFEDLLGTDLP